MKHTLHQGGPDALNFYTTTAGAYLGWAYLPEIVTKPGQVYLDGVVVDWESLRGVSDTYEGRYDQGETGTHEVGHWLNLSTPSMAAAMLRATSSTTRRPRRRPRAAARRVRTRAGRRGLTRSTTTWTTRTTSATRSSRPDRRSGCATPGCSTGPRVSAPLIGRPPDGARRRAVDHQQLPHGAGAGWRLRLPGVGVGVGECFALARLRGTAAVRARGRDPALLAGGNGVSAHRAAV